MKKIFQRIAGLIPRRCRFDLSYTKKFTADMGKIYTIMCEEVVPGDTWKVGNNIVIRFMPLVAPILHNIYVKVHYFFVPYRLLWSKLHNDEYDNALDDDWESFITGGVDGDDESVLPRFIPHVDMFDGLSADDITGKGSLWDLFGFPTGKNIEGLAPNGWQDVTHDNCPLIFPWAAYNLVYNEYYRDENFIDPVPLDNPLILNCCWNKDYFTAALPWQQRGTSPALPVVGTANAVFNGDFGELVGGGPVYLDTTPPPLLHNAESFLNTPKSRWIRSRVYGDELIDDYSGTPFVINPGHDPWVIGDEEYTYDNDTQAKASIERGFNKRMHNALGHNTIDLSTASTFNIADLRLAFQVQKWLERNARGGARYTEFLRAHFGVSPRDDRLQRPEYIGGSKSPVIISEVLQTSSTDSTSPQGNLAGHGLVASGNFCSSYTATEFGLILGLMTVVPDTEYQQGINKQWLRKTKYDFYSPEFANLSEQAIEEGEIFWTGDKSEDSKIFGYIGRHDEMRTKQNMTCSGMRDTFDYWHLGRKFETAPNLNGDFVTCKPSKRIFAVQDEDTLIVSFHNRVKAIRPLPLIAEPGLIDHH